MRINKAVFDAEGNRLFLAGALNQVAKKNGVCPNFGRIEIFNCGTA